jgi:hypothetical protein
MQIIGLGLSFEVPANWTQFRDGGRFIVQGPLHEELILSGCVLSGKGAEADRTAIINRLVENARQAMTTASSDLELIVTHPLQESDDVRGLQAWRIDARSLDGSILFCQAVIQHDRGMALLTFESPCTAASEQIYRQVLATLHHTGQADAGPRAV